MTAATLRPCAGRRHRPRGAGFTVIELLVVMAVIVVLVALIGGVGLAVIRNQQVSATQNVLTTLDRALEEYIQRSGGLPPYRQQDYVEVPGPSATLGDDAYFREFPSGGTRYPVRPDAAVFIRQATGTGEVDAIIRGLGDRFLRPTPTPSGASSIDGRDADLTPSVVDVWAPAGWGEVGAEFPNFALHNAALDQSYPIILYVHPQNLLAQELFGRCVNNRPYFMSAGPDGRFGLGDEFPGGGPEPTQDDINAALADNIYSYTPEPPSTSPEILTIRNENRN